MNFEGSEAPLGRLLRRAMEPAEVKSAEQYKQITVRLHHKGVVLRGMRSGHDVRSSRQFVARAGQLIVSRIDARHGAVGLVPVELDGAIVTSDFWLFSVDTSAIDVSFLDEYIGTAGFVDQCLRASEGTTNRVRLQLEQFLALTVPLPALVEQRLAVAQICGIRERIDRAVKLGADLRAMLDSLVLSLHHEASSGKSSPTHELMTLDEDRVSVQPEQRYPQVGVRSFGKGLFEREAVSGKDTQYRTFNRLYDGALVLSQVKGWEGAVGVSSGRLAGRFVSPEYRTFRARPGKLDSRYLATIVQHRWFWGRLQQATRGVGARRERTRPEEFLKLALPFPTIERQMKLIPLFDRVEECKRVLTARQLELEALVPSIVNDAFG